MKEEYNPRIVCILWIDSTTYRYGWSSMPTEEKIVPKTIMSCGVMVKEDEEAIILSTSYAPTHGGIMYNDFFVIPKGCIKQMYDMVIDDGKQKQKKR